jgi:hypothetical protein
MSALRVDQTLGINNVEVADVVLTAAHVGALALTDSKVAAPR